MNSDDGSFLGATVAWITRVRGRRGEVAAEVLTDFPERLESLREAYLWDGKHEPFRVNVLSCWLHKRQAIFHFQGYDSIADASRLRGWQVQVPLAERPILPQGHYYVSDLRGCEVWERGAATELGTVRDVQCTGGEVRGTPLLVVETARGEMLVPLAEEICPRVDIEARRIEVVLPEGLRELNQSS